MAIVVSIALVASLEVPVSAADPETPDDQPWQVPAMKSVPGGNAPVRPRRQDPTAQQVVRSTPKVTWPAAGAAAVAVPQTTGAAAAKAARAGRLPVWVAAPSATAARTTPADAQVPADVKVEVIGRRDDRLLMRLNRTDGVAASGSVSVRVDYSSFRHAYGGDWASRLKLVKLPNCALTEPDASECAGTVLPTRNDGSGSLTADVTVAERPSLFAVQATASSGAGDFSASKLSPGASWSVGGPSGDFTWSYPMDSPPSLGGPQLDLDLEYSSGNVDGRTSTTNNQPSWVGEGFELEPGGSIERRYKACAEDLNGNNGTRKTGDLCWGTDNAHIYLNGKSSELIRDDANGQWRLRNDDRSKVEHLVGAVNGDDDTANNDNKGEYWRITTPEGTQFYFGVNRIPGWVSGNAETKSTWTVPVFGNNSGEPCYTSSFASSHCRQAYRWNLDYVVDRHGNTMSLFYDTEINHYARNLTSTTVSQYVRAGNLARVEYGQRDRAVFTTPAVARVEFTTAERCIPGSACTVSQPATYPDTPLDQQCNSTTNCGTKYNPTFWTQKRLAKVTTQVWRGTAFDDVESWTFRHEFPDPGDGTRPGLWLEAITNAGHVGNNDLTTPEVNFDRIGLANRVDPVGDGMPPMKWFRVSAVHYGTGGELAVKYLDPECAPDRLPTPDNNTMRCYPVKWTPENMAERQDWFHKYVVTEVTESDRVTGLEPVTTQVEYLTPPAWHYDEEDGLVDTKYKTWSQWRGYGKTRVKKGNPAAGPQSKVEYTFWRGMDGDRTATGGRKSVSIVDSTGTPVPDHNILSGQIREEITYLGTQAIEKTINDQWISDPTATRVRSWGTTQAFQVEDQQVRQSDVVEGGAWRNVSTTHIYDESTGVLLAQSELNNVADPNDDTCTRYEYTSNPALGMSELPAREHVVSVACDKAWTNSNVISEERIYYDGSSAPGGTPTRGTVTKKDELAEFDATGNPIYKTVFTATYDAIGRALTVSDAMDKERSAVYSPSGAGPLTKITVTEPNGHVTTTEYEPAWGEETVETDPAGRRTETAYDALGRTSKVWLPGRTRADTPNFEYSYLLRADGPSVVASKSLQANGSYATSYELSDGLLRLRQTQEPAPGGGRMVHDVVYDSRGLEVKENGPYYNDAPPGTEVLIPNEPEIPTQKVTIYDTADRPLTEIFKSEGVEKWRTTYSHSGDRTTTDPPAGEEATTRISDSQGRLVELRQYTSGSPTGTYDKTTYTYAPSGQLASVTDPAGNVWGYTYDLRGRTIRKDDPDSGVTTYTYDDLDLMVTSTDSREVTLAYAYDVVGRPTAVHEGSLQGPKLTEWVYDTLAKGSPTSATRYVNGHAYTTRVTGYDNTGQPAGVQVVIPESEGKLAGTYTVDVTYNADGEVASRALPGVAGLPAETLHYGYNDQDLPTSLVSEHTSYVVDTEYTPFGEASVVTLRPTGGKWVEHKYDYETGTRRLKRAVTERETLPRQVSNTTYGYDPAGNITEIIDAPDNGETPDTQCFTYDHLQRLTQAWTPASGDCAAAPSAATLGGPEPYWHSWTFDKTGNRKSETRTTPTGGTSTSTYEYPAPGQPHPHALQKVTTTSPDGTTVDSYGYDAAGNQTSRTLNGTPETFTWNSEGALEKVAKGSQNTSYVYDADGDRLIRRDNTGTTLYLGDTEVLLKPDGTLAGTRYYEHGGQVVAVRTTSGQVYWLGLDHHGTVGVAIDATSQEVQRRRTTPYGTVRGTTPATWPTERGFVGRTTDSSTGLIHLGEREYDPATGRFISVDPVADYEDPQQINGYAYANNNPVSFTDPDGDVAFVVVLVPVVSFSVRTILQRYVVPRLIPVVVTFLRAVLVPIVKRAWSWLAGWIAKTVGWAVKHIVSHRMEMKRIFVWKTRVKKIRVKQVKKVKVKRPVKKPKSRQKPRIKKAKRNTKSAKKEVRKKKRVERRSQRALRSLGREQRKMQKKRDEDQVRIHPPRKFVKRNWDERNFGNARRNLDREKYTKDNSRPDTGPRDREPPRKIDREATEDASKRSLGTRLSGRIRDILDDIDDLFDGS